MVANEIDISKFNMDRFLAVGRERVHVRAISSRVAHEISFLRERIDVLRSFKHPNEKTIKTYREMLDSRETVLQWLEQYIERESGRNAEPQSEPLYCKIEAL